MSITVRLGDIRDSTIGRAVVDSYPLALASINPRIR